MVWVLPSSFNVWAVRPELMPTVRRNTNVNTENENDKLFMILDFLV